MDEYRYCARGRHIWPIPSERWSPRDIVSIKTCPACIDRVRRANKKYPLTGTPFEKFEAKILAEEAAQEERLIAEENSESVVTKPWYRKLVAKRAKELVEKQKELEKRAIAKNPNYVTQEQARKMWEDTAK